MTPQIRNLIPLMPWEINNTVFLQTGPMRLAYVALDRARGNPKEPTWVPKKSASFILPPGADYAPLQKAIENAVQLAKITLAKHPVKQNEGENTIFATSKEEFEVKGFNYLGEKTNVGDANMFYAGAWVRAGLKAVAHSTRNTCVFYVNWVQFLGHDEKTAPEFKPAPLPLQYAPRPLQPVPQGGIIIGSNLTPPFAAEIPFDPFAG